MGQLRGTAGSARTASGAAADRACAPQVAEQRRQDLQQEARRKGQPLSQDQMEVAEWTILVTTVAARLLTVPQALVLFGLRWQSEILFRRWKKGCQIDAWRTANPERILCELYAKLMAAVIEHWLLLLGCWHDPRRSLEKARQCVQREALRLVEVLQDEVPFERAITLMKRAMGSGCQLTQRGTRPNSAQLLEHGLTWDLVPLCCC